MKRVSSYNWVDASCGKVILGSRGTLRDKVVKDGCTLRCAVTNQTPYHVVHTLIVVTQTSRWVRVWSLCDGRSDTLQDRLQQATTDLETGDITVSSLWEDRRWCLN